MTVHRLAHPNLALVPGLVAHFVSRAHSVVRWVRGSLAVAAAFIAPVIWLAAWFMLFRSAVRTGIWF